MPVYDPGVERQMANFYQSLSEKAVGAMRLWKRRSWGMAARRILPGFSAVTPTRSSWVRRMWRRCLRMPLLAVSEKKGGRKPAHVEDPALVPLLRDKVKEHTAGSPVDPGKLWTNRYPAELADELSKQGHPVDRKTVQRI